MDVVIRPEGPQDYRASETVTREAFWNRHGPGCDEHHLLYRLRSHADYRADLSLVAEAAGAVVGSIHYTRSWLAGPAGRLEVVTFGPVAVHPDHQRQGIGAALIGQSLTLALNAGYPAVVIYGAPADYCRHGFRNGKAFSVSRADGRFPSCLLVRELAPGALPAGPWVLEESPAFRFDPAGFDAYDAGFPPKTKAWAPSQEEFAILSRSVIE